MAKRIKWLVSGVIFLALSWTVVWIALRWQADAQLASILEIEEKSGRQIDCQNQTIGGFPFRLEVGCTVLQAVLPSGAVLETGPLAVLTQLYSPNHFLAEVGSGVSLWLDNPTLAVTVDWALARGSTVLGLSGPKRASATADDVTIKLETTDFFPVTAAMTRFEAHVRHVDPTGASSIQAASRLIGLKSNAVDLPAVDLLIEANVTPRDNRSVPVAVQLQTILEHGAIIEVSNSVLASDTMRITLSGKLVLGTDGLLNGEMVAIGYGYEPLFAAIFTKMPDPDRENFQELILAFSAPTELNGKPARRLPLQIRNGGIFAGFWPLGSLPALF